MAEAPELDDVEETRERWTLLLLRDGRRVALHFLTGEDCDVFRLCLSIFVDGQKSVKDGVEETPMTRPPESLAMDMDCIGVANVSSVPRTGRFCRVSGENLGSVGGTSLDSSILVMSTFTACETWGVHWQGRLVLHLDGFGYGLTGANEDCIERVFSSASRVARCKLLFYRMHVSSQHRGLVHTWSLHLYQSKKDFVVLKAKARFFKALTEGHRNFQGP